MITCKQCGKEFEIKNGHNHQKFCSKSCAIKYRHIDDIGIFSRHDIDDNIKKYIIGLILTDGCIRKNGKSKTICISLSDAYMIKMIHDLACPTKKIYKDGNNCQVIWKNEYDILYLESLGISERKTYTIKLPNVENMWSLIRGVFDGDGCVYINKTNDKKYGRIYFNLNIAITSGSIEFIKDLKDFFIENNIRSTIVKDTRHNETYKIYIRRKDDVAKMRDMMYLNSGEWKLERKYSKFYNTTIAI